jgi:DNA-binding NarL/FixJ family response regulator
MKQITVLLAEDHTIVREGFRKMLELDDDIEVVGEAQDGRQAVALAKKLRPAVVLMDIAMPLLNGLEATRQVLKALPATKVLILSAHSDDAYVKNLLPRGMPGDSGNPKRENFFQSLNFQTPQSSQSAIA